MRLNIKSRKLPLTGDIRLHVEERVRSALDHVPSHISMVDVSLADVNGPRGGTDKLCQIRIQLTDGGIVVVNERDISILRAIDRSTTRAKRSVNERIKKRQNRRSRATIRDWQPTAIEEEVETPDTELEKSA